MRKIFHLSDKLIINDSEIGKAFGSMQDSAITKIWNFLAEIGLLKQLLNMLLRFLSVSIDENNSIAKWR